MSTPFQTKYIAIVFIGSLQNSWKHKSNQVMHSAVNMYRYILVVNNEMYELHFFIMTVCVCYL